MPAVEPCNLVILGGGAVMQVGRLASVLKEFRRLGAKVVAWGVGYTDHSCHSLVDYSSSAVVRACDIIGIREYGTKLEWTPCVSCMHPAFDREYEIRHEVVFYQNTATSPLGQVNGPLLGNNSSSMEAVVEFLASGETVVTSSYHGMYWATLLCRSVTAIPFSSKFYGFRYTPQYSDLSGWRKVTSKCRKYPEALSECREANVNFHDRVMSL